MGGAGKALIGGGKVRSSNSPSATAAVGGFPPIPHPLRVIRGQRFAPRRGGRHRIFTVTRVAVDGTVEARKEDERKEHVVLRAPRLLEANPDGTGVHYSFIAYTAGRRYRTFACVVDDVADDRGLVTLVLPDWHPGRLVHFPARLMPPGSLRAGTWLTCKADLGTSSGGALNIAGLTVAVDPGPQTCHRPTLEVPPS